MKRKPLLKIISFLTVWLYTSATVMAGQVITDTERDWAKKVVAGQADLDPFESTNSIAVLNYRNMTGTDRFDALQKGLALMLIEDLSKIDNISVLDRNKTQALESAIVKASQEADPQTIAATVGKKLQAGHVVSGDIQQGAFDQLAIATDLVETPFDNPVQLPFVSGNIDDLVQLEKDILLNLLERLKVHVSDHQKNEIMIPLTTSASALMALFLATDKADNGQYAEATTLYKQALDQDPGLQPARSALLELQEKGLTKNLNLPPEPVKAKKPATTPSSNPAVPPASKPVASAPKTTQENSGLSTGMKVGLGLGAVALVGVALAAGGGGGSSSSDDSSTGDTTSSSSDNPVASIDKTSVDCSGDTVTFRFTETMKTSTGSVSISPSFDSDQGWRDSKTYQIVWSLTDYCDNAPSAISMSLGGFSSAAGLALAGQSTFQLEFRSGAF